MNQERSQTLESDRERLARVRLNLTGRVGWRLAERLRARMGDLDAIFRASEESLRGVRGVGPALARRILRKDLEDRAQREIDGALSAGWVIESPGGGTYPKLLEETYDPPLILYRKGEILPEDARAAAIVGARRSTPYGTRQSGRLARDLAGVGWTIVSGLARGIDTAAHWGAIRSGGRTIAVLGTGLDVTYPPENGPLIEAICDGGGCVLTEFPRGTPPLRENFPRRNRVISGLSLGVIVVEASEKSGALITARWATEENREVFAVPGSVETGRSRGCHRLIRDGARIVETVTDVLEEFSEYSQVEAGGPAEEGSSRGRDQTILNVLRDGEMSIEEIGEAADLRPSELAVRLLRLEMTGAVKRFPGRRFALSQPP